MSLFDEKRSVDSSSKSVSTKTVGDKKIRITKTTINDGSGKVVVTTVEEEFARDDANCKKVLSTKTSTSTSTQKSEVSSKGKMLAIEDRFLPNSFGSKFDDEKRSVDSSSKRSVDSSSKSVSTKIVGDKKIRTTKTTIDDGSGTVMITTVEEEFAKDDANCEKVLSTKTGTSTEKADVSSKGRMMAIEDRFKPQSFESLGAKKQSGDFKVTSTRTRKYTGKDGAEVEEITEVASDGKMERTTVTTHSEIDGKKSTSKSVSTKYVSSS